MVGKDCNNVLLFDQSFSFFHLFQKTVNNGLHDQLLMFSKRKKTEYDKYGRVQTNGEGSSAKNSKVKNYSTAAGFEPTRA